MYIDFLQKFILGLTKYTFSPEEEVLPGRPVSPECHGVFLFVRLVKLPEDIMDGSRILIFMGTKKGCDQITRQLRMDGWPALSIHGDKSHAERDWVLSEFKSGKSPGLGAKTFALFNSLSYCYSVDENDLVIYSYGNTPYFYLFWKY